MTTTRRSLIVFCLFAFCADAHAILKSSVPRAKQVIKGPDVAITLTFNSRIDAKRSRVALVSADRSERALSLGETPAPDVMTALAKGLRTGSYILRWQVLASDGHISRGEIPFEVE